MKIKKIFLIFLLIFTLCGCNESENKTKDNDIEVTDKSIENRSNVISISQIIEDYKTAAVPSIDNIDKKSLEVYCIYSIENIECKNNDSDDQTLSIEEFSTIINTNEFDGAYGTIVATNALTGEITYNKPIGYYNMSGEYIIPNYNEYFKYKIGSNVLCYHDNANKNNVLFFDGIKYAKIYNRSNETNCTDGLAHINIMPIETINVEYSDDYDNLKSSSSKMYITENYIYMTNGNIKTYQIKLTLKRVVD